MHDALVSTPEIRPMIGYVYNVLQVSIVIGPTQLDVWIVLTCRLTNLWWSPRRGAVTRLVHVNIQVIYVTKLLLLPSRRFNSFIRMDCTYKPIRFIILIFHVIGWTLLFILRYSIRFINGDEIGDWFWALTKTDKLFNGNLPRSLCLIQVRGLLLQSLMFYKLTSSPLRLAHWFFFDCLVEETNKVW